MKKYRVLETFPCGICEKPVEVTVVLTKEARKKRSFCSRKCSATAKRLGIYLFTTTSVNNINLRPFSREFKGKSKSK